MFKLTSRPLPLLYSTATNLTPTPLSSLAQILSEFSTQQPNSVNFIYRNQNFQIQQTSPNKFLNPK